MFERKLLALDYATPDNFNINDESSEIKPLRIPAAADLAGKTRSEREPPKNPKELRSLVLWLEDQRIRHYKVEDRSRLRDLNSSNWNDAYRTYLDDIACPIKSKKVEEELEWLLSFAVRLEYGDHSKKYRSETSESVLQNQENVPKVISANPLDNLDFQSPEFISGVNSLANLLKVTQHPDHIVTLKAISKVVRSRFSPQCLENPNSVIVKGTPFPFQEADLGFDTGDYVLNNAAKIFRLLYIHNLRDLQTQINETIVAIQNITANPKTDTKLGQVGR